MSCTRGDTGSPVLDFSLLRLPTLRASIIGGFLFRLGIGALPFLLPLLMQVGFGLSPFQSGLVTFASARRRHGHEDAGRAHHPHLRLPQHDDGQRGRQFGLPRRLRAVHGDDAAAADLHHPGGRRLLPLAAVHRDQHGRLCRGRAGADEPRHHAGQRQPATGDLGRRRRRRVLGGNRRCGCSHAHRADRRRVRAGLPRGRADLGGLGLVLLADARRCRPRNLRPQGGRDFEPQGCRKGAAEAAVKRRPRIRRTEISGAEPFSTSSRRRRALHGGRSEREMAGSLRQFTPVVDRVPATPYACRPEIPSPARSAPRNPAGSRPASRGARLRNRA